MLFHDLFEADEPYSKLLHDLVEADELYSKLYYFKIITCDSKPLYSCKSNRIDFFIQNLMHGK